MDEISDHAKNLTLSEDLERTLEERVNLLFDFVKVTILWLVAWYNYSGVVVQNVCKETKSKQAAQASAKYWFYQWWEGKSAKSINADLKWH